MIRKNRIKDLIKKYLNNALSEDEKQELDKWTAESDNNKLLFEQLTNSNLLVEELKKVYKTDKEAGWQLLMSKIAPKENQ